MSAKVAKIIDWRELNEVNIKINEWETSDFFAKRNIKRVSLLDNSDDTIVFKTPVLDVAFGAKVSKYDDKKFDVAIRIPEGEFYNMMNNIVKQKFIELTKENCNKTGYEDDEEIIEEIFKSSFNHKEGYDPLFNGKIEENKYKKITFSDILIDENDKPVSNPDFLTELTRGTKVMLIIEIPHIDFYQTEFRPGYKIMKIKIVERPTPYVKNYITSESFESGKIEITEKETNKNGGTFSRVKYNFGEYAARVAIHLKNMRLAPFSFENTDETTGKPYYGVSPTIETEEYNTFLKRMSDDILNNLVKNSKNLLGKKKTEKMVKLMYMDILKYSKDDKELIKKGEDPKYKPRIDITASKYDEKFTFKFFNKDGVEMEEDFGEYKATNPDTHYDIKCSLRHLWYGKFYSIKFILDEIHISSSSSSSGAFKYKFGNEDDADDDEVEEEDEEVGEDNKGPIEEEPQNNDNSPLDSDEDEDEDEDEDSD